MIAVLIAAFFWTGTTGSLICQLPEGMTTAPAACTDDSPYVYIHSDGSPGPMYRVRANHQ